MKRFQYLLFHKTSPVELGLRSASLGLPNAEQALHSIFTLLVAHKPCENDSRKWPGKRLGQAAGSIAATVSKPKGGKDAFLSINLIAYLKLQKVSGNSG